jgi:uncharacterized protein YecA (UPF0149 family)
MMNCDTGDIRELPAQLKELTAAKVEHEQRLKGLEKYLKECKVQGEQPLAPLTEEEVKELKAKPNEQRKQYMRKRPCICGSNRKFKNCCWAKFTNWTVKNS